MTRVPVPDRLQLAKSYAFDAIDQTVAALRADGHDPIDFGVGDPRDATPEFIRAATVRAIETTKSEGYPPYRGTAEFRRACAQWTKRQCGVELDAEREVVATIGSKEAIFHFPLAVTNPGDVVICPDPGYPPYARGAQFAGCEVFTVPLVRELGYAPDLDAIPEDIRRRAKLFWWTQPNSPTGAVASRAQLERWITFCREYGMVAASDEAYSEIYFDERPTSAIEIEKEGVVVFQSLSKRSAMTGYRIGWCAGDAEIIELLGRVKTNIDSGAPRFIQQAAIDALADETHVVAFRDAYRKKRDLLIGALTDAGLPECSPAATFYVWQHAPDGMSGVELAKRLLHPDVAVVTMPDRMLISSLGDKDPDPTPGAVRFALVPTLEDCERAAARIRRSLELS